MIKVRLKLESLEEGTWMMGDNPWEVRKLSSKVDLGSKKWSEVKFQGSFRKLEMIKLGSKVPRLMGGS